MSAIGYYRYKYIVTTETNVLEFFKNGLSSGQKTVIALDYCEGDRTLKYLDENGQYRFFSFNKFYQTNDNPKLIGKTNQFITSILTNKTDSKNLGYRNERKLLLVADSVTTAQLEVLSPIWSSPRVLLYIGTMPSDLDSDWVEVTIHGDNTVKRRKANSGPVNVTVTLPKHFTITQL